MNHIKIGRFGMAMLLLMMVGCAIPLQQGPDPIPEQRQAAPAESQNRSMVTEDSASSSADEDAALSVGGAQDEVVSETVVANQVVANQVAEESIVEDAESEASSELPMAAVLVGETDLMTPTIDLIDLATLDQTFLETIDTARDELGEIESHRFIQVTDLRNITWQGETLSAETLTIALVQPMQAGGQIAVRLTFESTIDTATPEFEMLLAQLLTAIEIDLPDTDSFGLPNAEVEFVEARQTSENVWSFNVRLNHPDTGWEDYTDGWHVETLDGQILGVRILLHPHVNEMPFSRSQGGIAIPPEITEVQVRSHDLVSGYGQQTVTIPLGESDSGERYEVSR